jgi:TPR repeat protein
MREEIATDDRTRLLEAAGALMARGHTKFSIAALCVEAGCDRALFRRHFSSRAELMGALDAAAVAAHTAAPGKEPEAAPAHAPVAATADAWLERRLRVFERALTALEARADAAAREQAAAMARLEERVRSVMGESAFAAAQVEYRSVRVANGGAITIKSAATPDLEAAITAAPAAEPEIPADDTASGDDVRERQAALLLPLETPPQENSVPRAQMAELLEGARRVVRATVEEDRPQKGRSRLRLRWLALGCLSLAALFIGVGLTLGEPAGAVQMRSGSGTSYRHVAPDAFGRMVARADNGDPRAQVGLALAYLRGQQVKADPRVALHWAGQAAKAGDPLGQYLMGALYHQGEGAVADPKLAFRWFSAAARRGNIKAMHNLAIAYAEGLGTDKDALKAAGWFARAAERGYVDSAFDLAVLYERGDGLKQDSVQALKWYQVAAAGGDRPSQARADFLRRQMAGHEVARADSQTRAFERLTPLAAANALPAF